MNNKFKNVFQGKNAYNSNTSRIHIYCRLIIIAQIAFSSPKLFPREIYPNFYCVKTWS